MDVGKKIKENKRERGHERVDLTSLGGPRSDEHGSGRSVTSCTPRYLSSLSGATIATLETRHEDIHQCQRWPSAQLIRVRSKRVLSLSPSPCSSLFLSPSVHRSSFHGTPGTSLCFLVSRRRKKEEREWKVATTTASEEGKDIQRGRWSLY